MKMFKIKSFSLLLILSLFISNQLVRSQNCPTGSENWTSSSYTYDLPYYNANASVNYTHQNTGQGSTNIKVDWSSLNITNASTTKESGWKKAILENLVKKMVVDNCDHIEGLQFTVNYYYQKQCSTTTRFAYDLDVATQIVCCSNPALSQYIYDQWKNGVLHKVYYIYKDIVCSSKCCKKQYSCTIGYDNVGLFCMLL